MPSLPTSSNIGALPLDAVYEILLCLPAKLLCRLRAVCRPWRALLSDPQFALAHAARHPEPLIALAVAPYAGNKGDGVIVDIMDLSGQIVKRVRRVQRNDRVISMELDLAFVKNVNNDSYKFLNLATGVAHHLPDGFAEEHVAFGVNRDSDSVFILGQLPNTGEYKVLKLIHHVSNNLSSQLAEVDHCLVGTDIPSGGMRFEG
nr:unnamed protein product [Digitaria exilis]